LTKAFDAALSYFDNCDEIIIMEPDMWLWRPLTFNEPERIYAKVFREQDGRMFFHWPVSVIGYTACMELSRTMKLLLKYGASCCPWGPFPDRFIGFAADLCGVPVIEGNYASFNTVETEDQIQECLRAKQNWAESVHGVKNQQVLERLI
jgi:hypothetical protein